MKYDPKIIPQQLFETQRLYYEDFRVIQNGGTVVEKLLTKSHGLTMWVLFILSIANTNVT